MTDYVALLKKYPFLTYLVYGGNDYVGIIQNADNIVVSLYDYGLLKTVEDKVAFIELGSDWWNESSRIVPINVFLRLEWARFKFTLRTLNAKDVTIKFGPNTSLSEIPTRRTKRRSITLIRKIS